MTALAVAKTRKRYETACSYRGRPLMIELEAWTMKVRLKGTRTAYEIPYDAIYTAAGKIADRIRRAEKAKR
jgi:hypothetical protein